MPVTKKSRRLRASGNIVTDRRRGGNVIAWLDPSQFQAFDALARQRDLSRAELVREAIGEFLTAQERQ